MSSSAGADPVFHGHRFPYHSAAPREMTILLEHIRSFWRKLHTEQEQENVDSLDCIHFLCFTSALRLISVKRQV